MGGKGFQLFAYCIHIVEEFIYIVDVWELRK